MQRIERRLLQQYVGHGNIAQSEATVVLASCLIFVNEGGPGDDIFDHRFRFWRRWVCLF